MGKSKKISVNIENVVASVVLNQKIDLDLIAKTIKGVEYNPEQFPGLVFRLSKPKTATLIFNSGKMVCTGAKGEKDARKAINTIIKRLKDIGIPLTGEPEIRVQNIVASASLGVNLDLDKAAQVLPNTMYEPEQFPGLIFRMDDPEVVLLLFSSGKLVCTGAKKEEEVYRAVEKINKLLHEKGIPWE